MPNHSASQVRSTSAPSAAAPIPLSSSPPQSFPHVPISSAPDWELHCVAFHLRPRELRSLNHTLARFPSRRRGLALMKALRAAKPAPTARERS